MKPIKSICVYCGSQVGTDPSFRESAMKVGQLFAQHDITLVYGGGVTGIMGTCSLAAREAGGHVIGIIPQFLQEREAQNQGTTHCSEVIVTQTMHERKQLMFEKSDAFLALPGGIGTLEEVVEILTWAQIGRHTKPVGLLNINGFWNPLLDLFDHMKSQGFIHSATQFNPRVIKDAQSVVEDMM